MTKNKKSVILSTAKEAQTMVFIQELEKLWEETSKNLQIVARQLSQCPAGTLMISKERARCAFYQVTQENGRRIRHLITKDPNLIVGLARKKYLETERGILLQNQAALSQALKAFCETSPEQILPRLPATYRHLPKEYLTAVLTSATAGTGQNGGNIGGNIGSAEDEKTAWIRAPFTQSDYMPERRIHLTSQGVAVRSKSEVIIAEKLFAFGIPFRYEQVLVIEGTAFAPDFTIRKDDGSLFYWEHCGLTANEQYMYHHKQKLSMYERVGIVPWKNLIVTYDDPDGHVNLAIIESEIRNKLL